MKIEDVRLANDLMNLLEGINKDVKHLTRLAYILANDNVEIKFKMEIESQEHEDGKTYDETDIDSYVPNTPLEDLIKSLKESVVIAKSIIDKEQNRELHELTGTLIDSQGLQVLGIILAQKLQKKAKILKTLESVGVKCPENTKKKKGRK
jgi:hypothetical protein